MSSDDSQPPVVLVISHVRAYFKLNWIVAHAMRAPPFHCLPPMFTLIRFLSCTMIPPPSASSMTASRLNSVSHVASISFEA